MKILIILIFTLINYSQIKDSLACSIKIEQTQNYDNKNQKKIKLSKKQIKSIRLIIDKIILNSFPNLNNDINGRKKKFRYKIRPLNNTSYFFSSTPTLSKIFFGMANFRININPIIFDYNIPNSALKAILAHEIVHSKDYYLGSTLGTLLPIGLRTMRKKKNIQFERKTDLKTILLGYSKGLVAFKKWQYPLLTSQKLKLKKQNYLTPPEISLIMEIKYKYPLLIQRWLQKRIPTSLSEFQHQIKNYHE